MDAEREDLLPPPSSTEEGSDYGKKTRELLHPRKLCMANRLAVSDRDLSCIFILDLESVVGEWDSTSSGDDDDDVDVETTWDPVLRVFHGRYDAVCVLGSTLYIIDGIDFLNDEARARKLVYTCKLDEVSSAKKLNKDELAMELNKEQLKLDEPMNHVKYYPRATPTPDGKILVFSSTIDPYFYAENTGDICDIELYDPISKSWRDLPSMPKGKDKPIRIKMYTFRGKFVWFFTSIGLFRLDLQMPDSEGWKKMDNFFGAPRDEVSCYGDAFSLIGDRLILDPLCTLDLKSSRNFEFPGSSASLYHNNDALGFSWRTRGLTVLSVDDQECNFCIVQSKHHRDRQYVCLMIEEFKCNLIECKDEIDGQKDDALGSTLPGTKTVKSFRFRVSKTNYTTAYDPTLFTIAD